MNCVPRTHCCLFATSRSADNLVVLWYVTPAVKPQDTTVGVNHETQPNTIRDEKRGGGTLRGIVEEFLMFGLRCARDPGNPSKVPTVIYKAEPVNATAFTNAIEG